MPRAGTVSALLAYDSTILVGPDYGLCYRSTDLGKSWLQPHTTSWFSCLARVNSTLYAGSYYGLSRSTDNGLNWDFVDSIFNNAFAKVVISAGQTIIIGTNNAGIIRSADGATSWKVATKQPGNTSLICGCTLGTTFFIGTESGVYRSLDNGLTWTISGLSLRNSKIISLTTKGALLFCATPQGVYSSSDSGSTWVLAGLEDRDISTIAATPSSLFAALVLGGILRSDDDGVTWNKVGLLTSKVTAISVTGQALIVGSLYDGVFRSTDNGFSWEPCGFEPVLPKVMRFSDSEVYIGSPNSGVFRSTDNCKSWTAISDGLNTTPDSRPRITDIALTKNKIFVATDKGMFISTDRRHWVEDVGIFFDHKVEALAVDKNEILAAVDDGGICHSNDEGANWQFYQPSPKVRQFNERTLYKSNDDILVIGDSTVVISRNNGLLWGETFARNTYSLAFSCDNTTLLLGNYYYEVGNDMSPLYGGLYWSSDHGGNWQYGGVGSSSSVNDFTTTNGIAFTAIGSYYTTSQQGVHYSTDNGHSWKPAGLNYKAVSYLYSQGNTVYAIYDSVFRTTGRVSSVSEHSTNIHDAFTVGTNPITDRLRLHYNIPEPSAATIQIFNMLGECIATIQSSTALTGEGELNYSVGNLSSGSYILKIHCGNELLIRKMIKL